jgi:uncharacterized protein YceK
MLQQEKSGNTAESFKSEGLDKTLPAIEFPVSANLDTVLPESWISGNSVSDMLPDNSSNSESIFIK